MQPATKDPVDGFKSFAYSYANFERPIEEQVETGMPNLQMVQESFHEKQASMYQSMASEVD